MAKIIFQGFNGKDNRMILNGTYRRVLGSQKIWADIDNENGLIKFTIHKSDVPAEYQAKTIDMIMTEFINESNYNGVLERAYIEHDDRMEHFIDTIKNDMELVF